QVLAEDLRDGQEVLHHGGGVGAAAGGRGETIGHRVVKRQVRGDVGHPGGDALRGGRRLGAGGTAVAQGAQQAQRQLLGAVHGDLHGAVGQGGVREALEDGLAVGDEVGAVGRREGGDDVLGDEVLGGPEDLRVSDGRGDGGVAAQRPEIGERRVGAVEGA